MEINLKIPYTQIVSVLKLKPKTLILALSDNDQVFNLINCTIPKTKIYIPRNKYIFSKYISSIDENIKKFITRSPSVFRTLRPIIFDLNSMFYRLNNIIYYGRSKIIEKYINSFLEIIHEVKINEFKQIGYQYIALDYYLDLTKFSQELKKSDIKNMTLGVLAYLYKSRKYTIPFEKIILTLKLGENTFKSILIYNGKEFNVERILKIINNYIKLINSNEEVFSLNNISNISKNITKEIIKEYKVDTSEEDTNKIESIVTDYLSEHPELVSEISNIKKKELIEDIITSSAANLDITVKGNPKTIIKKIIQAIPSPVTIKPQKINEKVYSGQITLGNAHNFRREMFEKNLIEQIKVFGKYYQEKYNVSITKISFKTKVSDSIHRTTFTEVTITLKDNKTKKVFKINLKLPDLTDKNYIKYDGIKRVLVYQLYRYPIINPFPFTSMLKTNYASIEFKSKVINKNRGITVYVAGKEIPALFYLGVVKYSKCTNNSCKQSCFDDLLKENKIKFKTSDNLNDAKKYKYSVIFNKKVYYVDEKSDQKSLQLFWSFKQELKKMGEPSSCSDFMRMLEDKYGTRYIKNLTQIDKYIIDPITEYTLVAEKLPVKTEKLYSVCIDNAISGLVTNPSSLTNKRLRSSESLAVLIFKKITPAVHGYYEKKNKEIKVDPNVIINDLLAGDIQSQFQMVNDTNPLMEASMADIVTHAGYEGISTEFAKSEIRMSDDTFYGNIDPIHTPDSQAVGVVRHLSTNATIVNSTGKFNIYDLNIKLNPFSLADNYSPAPVHNDGNRIQYAAAQMQSDIPVINSELPYVASKYTHVFGKIVSDDFTIKAKDDGKVIKVTDNEIVIKYKNKKEPVTIPYEKIKLHSNNDLATENVPVVKEGDDVKKDDILVASKEFFKNNGLSLGVNLYTLLKPHGMYNFEDGIVISENAVNKLVSHHGDEVIVVVKETETIASIANIGDELDTTQPLVVKTAALTESDIDIKLKNKKSLLEFTEEDFDDEDEAEILDPGDELTNDDENTSSDNQQDEFSDQFSVKIYPKIKGQIYDIRIFAKDEKTLEKYPQLVKIRNEQINSLKARIKEYESEKIDASPLKEKLKEVIDCFGKKYKNEPVENVLIIFKIHGYKGVEPGDKLHNRHGKLIAA